MNSLRRRLIAVMVCSVMVFCMGWTVFAARLFNNWGDALLKGAAELVLSGLPDNLDALAQNAQKLAPGAAGKDADLSVQLWVDGRMVLRTRGAPVTPLKRDFINGLSYEHIDGRLWYVYSLAEPPRRLHIQVGFLSDGAEEWSLMSVKLGLFNMVLMLALFGVVILLVTAWSLRPVHRLREAVLSKPALDFSPLEARGLPRELQPLLQSFNRLLERLDVAVTAERRFLADAAHELRTPLAALITQAHVAAVEAARLQPTVPALNQALQQIAAGARRGARLSEQLLDQARMEALRGEATLNRARLPGVKLFALCRLVVDDLQAQAAQRGQQLAVLGEPARVRGDLDALGILLRNLVDNALRYSPPGGRVVLSCLRQWHGPAQGERICVRVADNGPGVPEDLRQRIFDRFYRVPGQAPRGSGIGLSLVADIARAHGAAIDLGPGLDGQGLAVQLWFEIDDSAEPAPA